jgi:ribulose-phosphate 3-epimerase
MQVIPAINCSDFECVRKKIKQTRELGSEWAHIDVADGRFTKTKTWNNPGDLDSLGDEIGDLNLEVHLMIEEPAAAVEDWLRAGVARVIVHFEALGEGWEIICDKIERESEELGLAINPETPAHVLTPYLKAVSLVELLAVKPGPAGQKFDPAIVGKLRELKQKEPDLEVEIDGGINLETAKLVRKAGADIVVSASYIWENKNPGEAFNELAGM